MVISVYGKKVEITQETIVKTREWYADNARKCIEDATAGVFRVNDLDSFTAWQTRLVEDSLSGAGDHTPAFVQMAIYIQTGESVPMLS